MQDIVFSFILTINLKPLSCALFMHIGAQFYSELNTLPVKTEDSCWPIMFFFRSNCQTVKTNSMMNEIPQMRVRPKLL